MARGQPTPTDVQEAVFAHYCTSLNYGETAAHFRMPVHTVWDIVQRLGGDALAELRTSLRARWAAQAWEGAMRAAQVAAQRVSDEESADAAGRTALSLAKVAEILGNSGDGAVSGAPKRIVIEFGEETGGGGPLGVAAELAQDTTLAKPDGDR